MVLTALNTNVIVGSRYDTVITLPIADSTTINAEDFVEFSSGKLIQSTTTLSTNVRGMAITSQTMGVLATVGQQEYVGAVTEGIVRCRGLVEGSGGTYKTALAVGDKVSFYYSASTGYGQFVVNSATSAIGIVVSGSVASSGTTDDQWDYVSVQLDFEAEAVISGTVADLAITTGKIANGAVTGTKIAAGAIKGTMFGSGAISSSYYLGDGVVASAKIVPGAVTGTVLAAGAVTGTIINAGSLTGTMFASGGLSSSYYYGDGSITGTKIGVGEVTSTRIAVGGILATNIAVGAVASTNVAVGGILGTNIGVGAIASTNIAVGGVTPTNIDLSVPIVWMSPTTRFAIDGGSYSLVDTTGLQTVAFTNTLSTTVGARIIVTPSKAVATCSPYVGTITLTNFLITGDGSGAGSWIGFVKI